MTVPSFADIGKNAWDIFRTGYHYGYGLFNISITNKSEKKLRLNSEYSLQCDTSQADGKSEAKLSLDRIGVLKQKWKSDGTILLEHGLEGKPIDGFSLTSGFSYNPHTSISGLLFGAKFQNEHVNLNCSVSNAFDQNFRLTGAAVLGIRDLHLGYQAGYDTEMNSMTLNDVGLAYNFENVGVHLRATSIPYEGGASVSYKVNENWDTVINGVFASRNDRQRWTVGIGTRMRIDDKTMVRLKLNKDRQMGASLQQKFYNFINLTLSFSLDLNNLPRGDHKVGLAIDIEDV
ncbi:voltage-dependent anion-selective channel protein 1-like [Venturia canescens]|uniref:voltage-dependent anion-selective channel protein 1-like n=1 Tax=Venturia canescens TaxID=32260 RepID=UPI001C9D6435|nr:voltage-dependent anion-selective channel protein 1-like [Venturia canescens]